MNDNGDIYWRRGGPGFGYPCRNPHMIECAAWKCQEQQACQALRARSFGAIKAPAVRGIKRATPISTALDAALKEEP